MGKEHTLCRVLKPIRIAVSVVKDYSLGWSSVGLASVFGGINKLSLTYFCRDLYVAANIVNMIIIVYYCSLDIIVD